MAIIGGYNVFPSEIDEVLHEYPKVQEAVALSVPHRSKGETLKAYVVPKPGEKITVAELVAHCRQKLASYKVPRMFEFRDELPKSMVGKVLRRALRDEETRKQSEDKEGGTEAPEAKTRAGGVPSPDADDTAHASDATPNAVTGGPAADPAPESPTSAESASDAPRDDAKA